MLPLRIGFDIMTDTHSQSFFGDKVGVIVKSNRKDEPFIYLQCIKKKTDGTWEKPSLGEGKIVRLSIEEIIQVIDVFSNETSWNTVHIFKEKSTRIAIEWDKDNKGFWINVGPYSRIIKFPQSEFLRQLLKHLMSEKVEFATSGEMQEKPPTIILESSNEITQIEENIEDAEQKEKLIVKKEQKDMAMVSARVKKHTEKALLLVFENGLEAWVPRSTIHKEYDENESENVQEFLIDTWILEKNNIDF